MSSTIDLRKKPTLLSYVITFSNESEYDGLNYVICTIP